MYCPLNGTVNSVIIKSTPRGNGKADAKNARYEPDRILDDREVRLVLAFICGMLCGKTEKSA